MWPLRAARIRRAPKVAREVQHARAPETPSRVKHRLVLPKKNGQMLLSRHLRTRGGGGNVQRLPALVLRVRAVQGSHGDNHYVQMSRREAGVVASTVSCGGHRGGQWKTPWRSPSARARACTPSRRLRTQPGRLKIPEAGAFGVGGLCFIAGPGPVSGETAPVRRSLFPKRHVPPWVGLDLWRPWPPRRSRGAVSGGPRSPARASRSRSRPHEGSLAPAQEQRPNEDACMQTPCVRRAPCVRQGTKKEKTDASLINSGQRPPPW